jgi:hypothetical protein
MQHAWRSNCLPLLEVLHFNLQSPQGYDSPIRTSLNSVPICNANETFSWWRLRIAGCGRSRLKAHTSLRRMFAAGDLTEMALHFVANFPAKQE